MFPFPAWVVPISTLIAVIGGFLLAAWRANQVAHEVLRLRENDLHELGERLNRIEVKLDEHITFHLTH